MTSSAKTSREIFNISNLSSFAYISHVNYAMCNSFLNDVLSLFREPLRLEDLPYLSYFEVGLDNLDDLDLNDVNFESDFEVSRWNRSKEKCEF